jgi:hypothetical protein
LEKLSWGNKALRVDGRKDRFLASMYICDLQRILLGDEGEERAFSQAPNLWDEESRISEEENRGLELTFIPECKAPEGSYEKLDGK